MAEPSHFRLYHSHDILLQIKYKKSEPLADRLQVRISRVWWSISIQIRTGIHLCQRYIRLCFSTEQTLSPRVLLFDWEHMLWYDHIWHEIVHFLNLAWAES